MKKISLGDVELSRVIEWTGAFATTDILFPSVPGDLWRQHESWLAPDFLDTTTNGWRANTQTWVLRSGGRTILVDTGLGNDKSRVVEIFNQRQGDFLDRLAVAGVKPDDVDLVINTHLHNDHVGWNTRLVDGEWVATFPNAQYLINRTEFDYWNPANGHTPKSPLQSPHDTATTFNDSVLPLHQTGRTVLWDGDSHRIDENLVLEPAPGHTPGSTVLRLDSGTDRALFVGDLVHTPLQFLAPEHDSCLSEDQAEASRSRRRVLEQAAATNALVVPAHLPGAGAAEIVRSGGAFAIRNWAPFEDA